MLRLFRIFFLILNIKALFSHHSHLFTPDICFTYLETLSYIFNSSFFFQSIFSKFILIFFFKKQTLVQVFSCEFCEIFKNTYFEKQLRTTVSGSILKFS